VNVLVVDDEPDFLATCVRLLALLGHQATTARDALEAIARIETGGVDLIITDMQMGPLGGQAVIQRAERALPPVPVIVITGHPSPDVVRIARRAGATLLAKPLMPTELRAAIDRARPPAPPAF
jgi:two-component system response regulator FlrC